MGIFVFLAAAVLSTAFFVCNAAADAPVKTAALDPRGIRPPIQRVPLSPRPKDMSKSTINLLDTRDGVGLIYGPLKAELEKRYPGVKVVTTSSSWGLDDAFIDKIAAQNNAFVFGGSGGSSGSQGAAYSAVKMEQRGVPGVHIACEDMTHVAEWKAGATGVPIRIVSTPCPKPRITDKEMAGIVDAVIDGLTRDLSKEERRSDIIKPDPPGKVAIEGSVGEIEEYFHKQKWTDGLPIVPPTKEAVAEMLKGTSHARNEVIAASWGCEGWGVTVEAVAINAVMAGAKPEYMPALLATVQAADLVQTRSQIGGRFPTVAVSTNGFGFMQVINGPYAREIGMNSGRGALGPGYRPNAAIGRAFQLFVRNLGGCASGISMNPTMGNNSLQAGVCFAEAEDSSPWEPLHVSKPALPLGLDGKAYTGAEVGPRGAASARAQATANAVGHRVSDGRVPPFGGFDRKESVLTFMVLWNAAVGNYFPATLDRAKQLAQTMAHFDYPSGMIALISPDGAVNLAEKEGMSKDEFADFLYKNAKARLGDLRKNGGFWNLVEPNHPGYAALPDDAVVSVYPRQYIRVIVVGARDQVQHIHGWNAVADIQVSIDKWR
jgi:hypothetical protein